MKGRLSLSGTTNEGRWACLEIEIKPSFEKGPILHLISVDGFNISKQFDVHPADAFTGLGQHSHALPCASLFRMMQTVRMGRGRVRHTTSIRFPFTSKMPQNDPSGHRHQSERTLFRGRFEVCDNMMLNSDASARWTTDMVYTPCTASKFNHR